MSFSLALFHSCTLCLIVTFHLPHLFRFFFYSFAVNFRMHILAHPCDHITVLLGNTCLWVRCCNPFMLTKGFLERWPLHPLPGRCWTAVLIHFLHSFSWFFHVLVFREGFTRVIHDAVCTSTECVKMQEHVDLGLTRNGNCDTTWTLYSGNLRDYFKVVCPFLYHKAPDREKCRSATFTRECAEALFSAYTIRLWGMAAQFCVLLYTCGIFY